MQGDDKTIPSLGGRWPFNHEHCTRDPPNLQKYQIDLGVMIDNWNEFIRLAVISKEPQPVTRREREDLKR